MPVLEQKLQEKVTDMSWNVYDIAFRLISPLHIGYRKVSNLQQTRGYVPSKTLWAALTARLTGDTIYRAQGKDYEHVGEKINRHIRFSYFYPSLNKCTQCFTWENEDDFSFRFLDSYMSTALSYDHFAALEGSLHEIEFIRPQARTRGNEESRQVYLVGQVYVHNNLDDTVRNWEKSLEKLQLGGERGYGWGRVELVMCQLTNENPHDLKKKLKNGKEIQAHVLAETTNCVKGRIEPLIGWERDNQNKERNWRLNKPLICFEPGSIVNFDTTSEVTFIIDNYGIWKQVHTL